MTIAARQHQHRHRPLWRLSHVFLFFGGPTVVAVDRGDAVDPGGAVLNAQLDCRGSKSSCTPSIACCQQPWRTVLRSCFPLLTPPTPAVEFDERTGRPRESALVH